MKEILFNVGTLYKGTVKKRPSQECKTPYVADVIIDDTNVLAHTAALGCSGLADKNETVLMIHINKPKNICSHKILITEQSEKYKRISWQFQSPGLVSKSNTCSSS